MINSGDEIYPTRTATLEGVRRLHLVIHDLTNNVVGRAYALWELGRFVGLEVVAHGISRDGIWKPLSGSGFASSVKHYRSAEAMKVGLTEQLGPNDVLVPLKTWPQSLGVALRVSEALGRPLVVDIDDPDHAALVGPWASTSYRLAFRTRMRLRGTSPREFDRLDRKARDFPRMVSNPALEDLYGDATIVPHPRWVPDEPIEMCEARETTVAFVGTPRRHKGLLQLRNSVEHLAPRGFRLVVTAPPPRNAAPWEEWIGVTTLADGRRTLESSDIVVVPQQNDGYGRAQLPARLIDAMAIGRPVLSTTTEPIRWAVEGHAILVDEPSTDALIRGLEALASHEDRVAMGRRLHEIAARRFSIEAVSETFTSAIGAAVDDR